MTSNNNTGHSAEYFGASRDFWWNHDFLALMAQRLRLDQCTLALDVGCGIGHWGFTLARAVNPRAQWTGVDREPNWVRRAGERARDAGLAERFRFVEGTAQALPFHDASFDLVTCQTVLIHLPDPRVALREMQRVLRPGGRLLVVEPNNLVGHALLDSLKETESVEDITRVFAFHMTCERGKRNLGQGNNSVGDLIPGYVHELGFQNIDVHISDKATPWLPPYDLPEQQAILAQDRDWVERNFWIWDRNETQRNYLAGGGRADDFEATYQLAMQRRRDFLSAVESGTYHCAGGSMQYLISATK